MSRHLQEMVGRTYAYNGLKMKIAKVTLVEDDLYDIFTDQGKRIRLTSSEVKSELVVISPKDERETSLQLVSAIKEGSGNMSEVEKLLMQSIRKVAKSGKNIPQAKGVNEMAKTMISLSKHKLDTAKFIKSVNTNK